MMTNNTDNDDASDSSQTAETDLTVVNNWCCLSDYYQLIGSLFLSNGWLCRIVAPSTVENAVGKKNTRI